jgi:hypothetical protein
MKSVFITLSYISVLLPRFTSPYRIISILSIDLHASRNFSLRNNVHSLSCSYPVDSQSQYMWHQSAFETADP